MHADYLQGSTLYALQGVPLDPHPGSNSAFTLIFTYIDVECAGLMQVEGPSTHMRAD